MTTILQKLKGMKGEKGLRGYVACEIWDGRKDYKGKPEEQIRAYMEDLMWGGCQSGYVGSLIYCNDTHEFFDRFSDEILELYINTQEELGEPLRIDGDPKNWLSWFSFEETARAIASQLDIEI